MHVLPSLSARAAFAAKQIRKSAQCAATVLALILAIHLATVTNLEDSHFPGFIINSVQKAISTDADPPTLLNLAPQSFHPGGSRTHGQSRNDLVDPLSKRLG
jgi:hypothetical protein